VTQKRVLRKEISQAKDLRNRLTLLLLVKACRRQKNIKSPGPNAAEGYRGAVEGMIERGRVTDGGGEGL